MRRFFLDRIIDDSGVSGTGRVAEGCEFDTKQCVVCWIAGEIHSIVIYQNIDEVQKIHGHGSHTQITWVDKDDKND